MKIAGESTIRNLRTNQRKDRDHPPHLEQPEKEQNEITKSTPERERFSVPHAAGDPKILQDRNLENEDMFELIKNPPEIGAVRIFKQPELWDTSIDPTEAVTTQGIVTIYLPRARMYMCMCMCVCVCV